MVVSEPLLAAYLGDPKAELTQTQQVARWAIYGLAVVGVIAAGRWRQRRAVHTESES
jgi:hypothetical protein